MGGNSWTDISLQNRIDFTTINAAADLKNAIQVVIDEAFSVGTVTTTLETGPTGTQLLQFAAANGDVRIEPATQNDFARILMLGTNQGGIEQSRHACP